MATVRDFLARKGSSVITVEPDQTVLQGARLMNDKGIGGLLVMENGRLVGIFTERDVMRRVVATQRDPAATKIRDVMTSDVITSPPDTDLGECRAVMTQKRIRHLPIAADGTVHGIITIGDLMAIEVAEQLDTIGHLQSYVFDTRPV
ncbi:MAG TPA: CBS domain-containing protein [Gemmatimonadaceae bacterium]|nr:CBS domain-containing protein [Gemmatimonadaceae bacterium]